VPPNRPDPKALEAAWAALEDILSPYGGDGMEFEDGTVVVDPTSDPSTHPDVRRQAFIVEIEKIATHGCDVLPIPEAAVEDIAHDRVSLVSGQIRLRRLDGWRQIPAILREHRRAAA
jgi:hypothetical protein